MEYRVYYLAREWVRLGHHVKVVASAYSHVRAQQPQLAENECLDETIDGIEYTWFKTPLYEGNGIGRVRNMASFVWQLYREGKRLARSFKPDVVIASSTYPMDIWPARRIAALAKAKLVFEVHDLWPLSPMELGGMSKWHPFIMLVQAAEDYAYRHADVVVSMLPKVREYMESRGMAPEKLYIVPNGIDPAEWGDEGPELAASVKETLSNLKSRGMSIVGYAGSHGVANALGTLLEAAKMMRDEPVVFVLVGGGPDKEGLQRRARVENLKNVLFVDAVKKEQIPALLSWFDVAYIGLQSQPLFRFGIAPNKLMDYMMAARPILVAVEAGNAPASEASCGLTIKPEDPKAVTQGIRSLLALTENDRYEMGQRGKNFILKSHTYPVLAQQFMAALE